MRSIASSFEESTYIHVRFSLAGIFLDHEISHDQAIHLASEKSAGRLRWSIHDGFAPQIERCVQHHWDAGGLAEAVNQCPIAGALLQRYGLQPRGAVYVRNRWESVPQRFPCWHYILHISSRVMVRGFR